MAQLCTNAPPITNSGLNGSHLHECLLTHSEYTQPTQMKCSPYTLRMHSANSNEVLSLHTQNALNQLKSSAPLTHSECTQRTQMKCSPYTLKMHSTNSNQVLPLHTQNALNQLKSRATLTHSECTQPTGVNARKRRDHIYPQRHQDMLLLWQTRPHCTILLQRQEQQGEGECQQSQGWWWLCLCNKGWRPLQGHMQVDHGLRSN